MSQSNCPVCQEDLHTSSEPCQIPPCNHLVHKSCFDRLLDNRIFYCPICSKSLMDLSPLWSLMYQQIEKHPMQGKFQVWYFVGLTLAFRANRLNYSGQKKGQCQGVSRHQCAFSGISPIHCFTF